MEEEYLPRAPEGFLLQSAHLCLPGRNSRTPVPIIEPSIPNFNHRFDLQGKISVPYAGSGPLATHSVTITNEATSNVPNSSMSLTWPEDFFPTTSPLKTTFSTGFFPVGNGVSPGFQEAHLLHQPLYTPNYCPPLTERSASLSPSLSSSSLVPSCSASSCRRPIQVDPSIILSNPKLYALAFQIFSESWFLNGQVERNLTDKEASNGLGFMGKSVFLAFASRLGDGSARVGKWRCLICDTLPVTFSDGKGYTTTREDRILKHIRHHFRHRPWVCEGQCGMGEW